MASKRIPAVAIALFLAACGGTDGTATSTPAADRTPRLERFVGAIAAAEGLVGAPLEYFLAGDIAADRSGNLYVAYYDNAHRITPAAEVTRLASDLFEASGLAVDDAGNAYVGKTTPGSSRGAFIPSRAVIRKVSTQGTQAEVSPLSSSDGTSLDLVHVTGLATHGSGNLYIADRGTNLILRLAPDLSVATVAGIRNIAGGTNGPSRGATFDAPVGLAVDAMNNIFVAENHNHAIRRISADGTVSTYAGRIGISGHADGPVEVAMFNRPAGIALDPNGNLYVADTFNHVVRKITPAGIVTTVVGTPGVRGFVPGGLPGVLNTPLGVAIVGDNLYITMRTGIAVVRNRP